MVVFFVDDSFRSKACSKETNSTRAKDTARMQLSIYCWFLRGFSFGRGDIDLYGIYGWRFVGSSLETVWENPRKYPRKNYFSCAKRTGLS